MEAHLVRRQGDGQGFIGIRKQPVQFEDGLAGQNHFLPRQFGFDGDAGVGQTMAIGGTARSSRPSVSRSRPFR